MINKNYFKCLQALSLIFIFNCTYAQDTLKNKRMEWWREARFGMFIHWGLYSVPSGEWGGKTDYGEWIRTDAQIPVEVYDTLVTHFNPIKFNAEDIVKTAKDAGMKYIVITTKHHDGFCLFDSKYTTFDIMSTPYKKDIMKELATACRKYDMKICWYHSIMDWHDPDYLPRRDWEKNRSTENADYNRYFEHLKNQLHELLTNYGDIGVIWFDGEWENTWNHKYAVELYTYLRALSPNVIINNRIDVARSGMEGFNNSKDAVGDYCTPEQEIPSTNMNGVDWESCMTMNNHWGYNKNDNHWKSAKEVLNNLSDITSKGGNYLLNVGPTPEGLIPQGSVDVLKKIGNWMKINGEAIYGTQANPFKDFKNGRCTQKEFGNNTKLYFHISDWPLNGLLTINNLISEPIVAYVLSDPKQTPLEISKQDYVLKIAVPKNAPDSILNIIVLEIKGRPIVVDSPEFEIKYFPTNDEVRLIMKADYKEKGYNFHYTVDGTTPTESSPILSDSITCVLPVKLKGLSFNQNKKLVGVINFDIPLSYKKDIKFKTPPPAKYNPNGKNILNDNLYGSTKFTDGKWVGFEGADFDAVMDLGKIKTISEVSLGYLSSSSAWIFEPLEIIFEVSEDGKNFKQLDAIKNNPDNWIKGETEVKRFQKTVPSVKARYVRFFAKNRLACPAGHSGNGGKAWVFIDEISVN